MKKDPIKFRTHTEFSKWVVSGKSVFYNGITEERFATPDDNVDDDEWVDGNGKITETRDFSNVWMDYTKTRIQ